METMKAFGCWNPGAWRALPADDRARMIFHEIRKNMRELWSSLKMRKAQERRDRPKGIAPFDQIRKQFFGE